MNDNLPQLPGYMTPEDAAEKLGYKDASFLRRMIRDGRVRAFRVDGRTNVIPDAEVERLASEERKPGPKPAKLD